MGTMAKVGIGVITYMAANATLAETIIRKRTGYSVLEQLRLDKELLDDGAIDAREYTIRLVDKTALVMATCIPCLIYGACLGLSKAVELKK